MISDISFIKKERFFDVYLLLFYVLLTFILYHSSLNNFFVLDDFTGMKAASDGSLSINFHFIPVPLFIYRIMYLIFGLNPVPLRVLNFLINAVVCVFVFKLSYKLFDKKSGEKEIFNKSVLCSFLFCIHYIHVETIIYFSELHELFYSLFYVLGLYAYLSYRTDNKKINFILIFIFYMLCQFSKETAVTFIACLFLSEIFLFKARAVEFIKKYYLLFLIVVLFTLLRYFLYPRFDVLEIRLNVLTLAAETIKNVIFTFTAFVVSLDFTFIKDIYKANNTNYLHTFYDISAKYPFAIAGILISVLFYILVFKRRDKITNISFLYIFITISSFMWLVGYERYLYLPSIGFCILLINYLFKIAGENAFKKRAVMLILFLFFAYNIYSLKEKESHWLKASDISRTAVVRILDLTKELPPGSKVYFKDLPGEYKSAWILRNGIHEIPELFLKRTDLYFYYIYQKPKDKNENGVYIYDYYQDRLYIE